MRNIFQSYLDTDPWMWLLMFALNVVIDVIFVILGVVLVGQPISNEVMKILGVTVIVGSVLGTFVSMRKEK